MVELRGVYDEGVYANHSQAVFGVTPAGHRLPTPPLGDCYFHLWSLTERVAVLSRLTTNRSTTHQPVIIVRPGLDGNQL